ncbi:hypothetical protein [Brevibacterium luteolum]|nr:hypothetical protein [Brevibacterium luteolum]
MTGHPVPEAVGGTRVRPASGPGSGHYEHHDCAAHVCGSVWKAGD